MLPWLADRLILQPSTRQITVEGKTRQVIGDARRQFEVWIQHPPRDQVDLFILKFPGTGGRAERATEHPADAWPDISTEVWAVNPPGYGKSGGRASIRHTAHVAAMAFQAISAAAQGKPIIVAGNSLGTVAALFLAATEPVNGLLLRNPPPLRELIVGKHGWWNLGLSRFIAQQVPEQLCSIRNAQRTDCAVVFVISGRDRTVPRHFQQRIVDAHRGQNRILLLPDADHATRIEPHQEPEYVASLNWLCAEAFNQRRVSTRQRCS